MLRYPGNLRPKDKKRIEKLHTNPLNTFHQY